MAHAVCCDVASNAIVILSNNDSPSIPRCVITTATVAITIPGLNTQANVPHAEREPEDLYQGIRWYYHTNGENVDTTLHGSID